MSNRDASRPKPARQSRARQRPAQSSSGLTYSPWIALIAGVVLIVLATPRLVAAVIDLPARPVIVEISAGKLLDSRLVAIAADSRASALDWVDSGRGRADLGFLHFVEARRLGLHDAAGQAHLGNSRTIHRQAVSLSPVQAHVWTRLAHTELLQNGPSARVSTLLGQAIASAPFNPVLVFQRLELCFLTWRNLDPGVRAAAAGQIRFAASIAPKRLARLAVERYAMAAVREALLPMPDLRRRVGYYLRRL
jgi:hypothetical protein